jgi:hypothetical protein
METFQEGCTWWKWPDEREQFKFQPVFHTNDQKARVLGNMRGVGGGGFAVRDMGSWTSVFVGAPLLPVAIIRNILEDAGVHIYTPEGDVVYANSRYLCVAANGDGPRTIRLPGTFDVADGLSGEPIGQDLREIGFDARHAETRIFRLDLPSGRQ